MPAPMLELVRRAVVLVKLPRHLPATRRAGTLEKAAATRNTMTEAAAAAGAGAVVAERVAAAAAAGARGAA